MLPSLSLLSLIILLFLAHKPQNMILYVLSHDSEAVFPLNVCLAEIGETSFSQSTDRSKAYCRQKVKKITEALQQTVITRASIDDVTEMIRQLKEKLLETVRLFNGCLNFIACRHEIQYHRCESMQLYLNL